MNVVIHHDPGCGTSRNVPAPIEETGEVPVIIPYLETGWTRPYLLALFAEADLTPRAALRTSNLPAEELGLLDQSVDDETPLAAMVARPILVNRPIVCTPRGVRLCRPSETVLELLDAPPEDLG